MRQDIDLLIRNATDKLLVLEWAFTHLGAQDLPDSVKRRRARSLARKIREQEDIICDLVDMKTEHFTFTEDSRSKAIADLIP